jgi:hypothetical protein
MMTVHMETVKGSSRPGLLVPPEPFAHEYRVTRSSPCPVCEKPDWCVGGDGWAICQRVESGEQWGAAGWLHRMGNDSPESLVRRGRAITIRRKVRGELYKAPKPAKLYAWAVPTAAAIYCYNLPNGDPHYRKLRYQNADGSKATPFQVYDPTLDLWREGTGCMEGVERVLYHVERLAGFQTIAIVEGEKCADTLWDYGVAATTSGSCRSWEDRFAQWFIGKTVVVFPDEDIDGHEYAEKVARSLRPVVRSLKVVRLPGLSLAEDVHDWLTAEVSA